MKTVKVRVAVAVDPAGNWSAYGYGQPGIAHDAHMDIARDGLRHSANAAHFWITATLLVPEVQEVAASVEIP